MDYCRMFRYDRKLNGKSEFIGPRTAVTSWTYKIDDERVINLQPTIDEGGNIYVATWGVNLTQRANGKLYKLNNFGQFVWLYAPGQTISPYLGTIETAPVILSSGEVVIGRGDGVLRDMAADGIFQWSFNTDSAAFGKGQIMSSPIVDDNDNVYFGTQRYSLGIGLNKVYCVSNEGNLVWKTNGFSNWVNSAVSIDDDGKVYFTQGNKVMCYNSAGVFQWDYRLYYKGSAVAIIDNVLLCPSNGISSESSKLYGLNKVTQQKIWEQNFPYAIISMPAIYNNRAYVSGENNRESSSNPSKVGTLYCIDIADGTILWELELSGSAGGRPPVVDRDGAIYVATRGYNLSDPVILPKIFMVTDNNTSGIINWQYTVPEGEIWGGYPVIGSNKTLVYATAVCTEYETMDPEIYTPVVYQIKEQSIASGGLLFVK